jgi:rhamnulokinase
MSGSRYIAIDLGAESGRLIAGFLRDGQVTLEEVHRFANIPVRTPDGLHWDLLRLFHEILTGLRAAADRYAEIAGIGVDSWAVDYGLLDERGRLLGNPYHYRDARTDGVSVDAATLVPAAEQYARTGIAQLPFNTIYQLVAQRRSGDHSLDRAASLLMIPDLLHYWLSGIQSTEYTNASTTGALGVDGRWTTDILERLAVPSGMLLNPAPPGTMLGTVSDEVRAETGLGPVPVLLPATHDTACAVAAVPATAGQGAHAYISSGTWSLLGLELDRPIIGESARQAGFTNEGGVGGTYRFLTNIMGLWIVQECRRAWSRAGHDWSYDDLTMRAAACDSPGVVINVDDPAFLHPDDMPQALSAQLQHTGQAVPDEPAGLVRAVLDSLALKYRFALEQAEALSGRRVEVVHMVGGGSRNALLCQLAANMCARPVLAGPAEGTALGNILVQAMASGEVAGLAEAHVVARASTTILDYEPRHDAQQDEAFERLRGIIETGRE